MLATYLRRVSAAGGGSHLDTQTVVTGGDGSAINQDRSRGFATGGLGSISDGASNIFGGAAITALYWDENALYPLYVLAITGATDAGWTTLTVGSNSLLRTDATYSGGTWTWSTADNAGTQAFGTIGSTKTIYFD